MEPKVPIAPVKRSTFRAMASRWSSVRRTPPCKAATEAGVVTLYTRSAAEASWTRTAEFGAKEPDEEGFFGSAVALSQDGNSLIVGAPGQNGKGSSFVFTRTDGEWDEGTLVPFLAANNDRVGAAVAMSSNGKVIAVGVPSQRVLKSGTSYSRSGQVWIYEYVAGVWTLRSFVASSIPQTDQYFGSSVAMSGDGTDIVVGAPQFDMYSEA